MSTCIVCDRQAFHCEKSNPALQFCDSQCQFLHYALIAAGGKRERDEEDPQQPITGVDFTEYLDDDTLIALIEKFKDIRDLFKVCGMNTRIRSLCQSRHFQLYYLRDTNRLNRFVRYLDSMNKAYRSPKSTEHLNSWIAILKRDLKYPGIPPTLQRLAAKTKNPVLLDYLLEDFVSFVDEDGNDDPKKYDMYSDLLLCGDVDLLLKYFQKHGNVNNWDESTFYESAIRSNNIEMVRFVCERNQYRPFEALSVIHALESKFLEESRVSPEWLMLLYPLFVKKVYFWGHMLSDGLLEALDIVRPKIGHVIAGYTYALSNNRLFSTNVINAYANHVGSALPTHHLINTLNTYRHHLDHPNLKQLLIHPLITDDMKIQFFTNLNARYDPDSELIRWMIHNKTVDLAQDGYAWFYMIQFDKNRVRELFKAYPPLEQQLREAGVIH